MTVPALDGLQVDSASAAGLLPTLLVSASDEVEAPFGSKPVFLDDPDSVWLVIEGSLDIFVAQLGEGGVAGVRKFLWTAEDGSAVLGTPPREGFVLIATASAGTTLRRIRLSSLAGQLGEPARASIGWLVHNFAAGVGSSFGETIGTLPPDRLECAKSEILRAGQRVAVVDACWLHVADGSVSLIGDESGAPPPGMLALPVERGMLLVAGPQGATVRTDDGSGLTLQAMIAGGQALAGIFMQWSAAVTSRSLRDDSARSVRRADLETRTAERRLEGLAAGIRGDVGHADARARSSNALLAACQLIGAERGIEFVAPPEWALEGRVSDELGAICGASRVRYRKVALRGEWWRSEFEPMLAFVGVDRQAVALVSQRGGGVRIVDAYSDGERVVTAKLAESVEPFGYCFYRPFPDRMLKLREALRFVWRDVKLDTRATLGMALLGGAVSLVPPIIIGFLVGDVIPGAERNDVLVLFLAMAAAAIGGALFDITRAFSQIRSENRSAAVLQAAVLDRLLSLPAPFFRNYSVGDLAMRANAINTARDMLSSAALASVLAAVFSVVNLGLLFIYSPLLALVALGIVAASVSFILFFSVRAVRVERGRADLRGQIAGLLFQVCGGIAKLRVAGAERRAFVVWAELFERQLALRWRANASTQAITTFNAVAPIVSSMALFGMSAGLARPGGMSTGAFIAFSAAFGSFFAAGLLLSQAVVSFLNIVPVLERAQPILQTLPERSANKPDPGTLHGRIEAGHLKFRYRAGGPLALDDVSFHADPGEFIAFVGPSGSGKSTILRILLGFEAPEGGQVFFDDQELSAVDISSVRGQIGTVLQSSRLMSGDILTNIVGTAPRTLDEAWEAARMAGLADDIRDMPMGMNTIVSEGGTTLSGGQRQRLLIARALVRKPRMVLFDEATSALDNRTQEIVSRSLERMNATRIVIAHRLSTIRNADRLYVMERGKLIQTGTYDELAAVPGLFADLAKAQAL